MARKRKKKTSWIKRVLLTLLGLTVLIVGGVVLYAAKLMSNIDYQTSASVSADTNDLSEETLDSLDGYTTIALFGVDNRSNGDLDTGNSDSIMLLSINNETKEVKVCSVYRDTYMKTYSDTYAKCNSAYANGGATLAESVLNTNLDLDIEYYITLDFYSLAETIDLLGGIDMELTEAEANCMNSKYIDQIESVTGLSSSYVSAGEQHLDGVQAVAYCRIRATSGYDFKRTSRQRTVLKLMFEEMQSADLSTITKIADQVFPHISTDLSLTELISMGSSAMSYSIGGTDGFPFDKTTIDIDKINTVIPVTLESNVIQLHQFLYGDEDYTPSSEVTSISDYIEDFTNCTPENTTMYEEDYE